MKTQHRALQRRAAALLSLLALGAPGLASAQQADAVLVADGGVLSLHSGDTQEALVRCSTRNTFTVVVPPHNTVVNEQPCLIASLAAHTLTGRWAFSVDLTPSPSSTKLEVLINGTSHEIQLGKDRANISSGIIVYGDARGVIHTWPGIPKSRNKKGGMLFQSVSSFSADGSRLWLALLSSYDTELWSWSLEPEPRGEHLKAPLLSDKETGMLLSGGHQLIIREHNGSKLRAASLPADGSPRFEQVTPIKRGDASWRAPLMVGDEVFYYVVGKPAKGSADELPRRCDASRPGSYRRFNIKTGEDRAWRVHPGCQEEDPRYVMPGKASPSIFFNERDGQLSLLYQLDVATDAVRVVPLAPDSAALAASPDASTLLVRAGDALGLWDVQAKRYRWQTKTVGGTSAIAAFTAGPPPRTAPPAAPQGDLSRPRGF
jgi:hypothetical protein